MTPMQNIVTSLILIALGALFAVLVIGAMTR
jgi:hypothetical protein